MKTLNLIAAALLLLFGTVTSRGANLTRISDETGVSVDTLQAERASTGLGWGGLEKAHLLANASGQSFDDIVARHQAGEGWGKIAHDNGLNLGRVVSSARRSDQAASHAQNTQARTQNAHAQNAHARNAQVQSGRAHNTHHMGNTTFSRSHAGMMSRRSSGMSSRGGFHGMSGMGHGHGGHGR
jgi:hypothetical protein